MVKYAIVHVDNGSPEYLVMFGYDGGKWHIRFASGDLFRPVTVMTAHEAYNLLNLIESMDYVHSGSLYVEEVDLDG